ncbi:MAG: patatin-like phospholipase family protein [Xanthomonadales bacterium]|nr:patatin-like phospholipase family protein [Xanthomonadales bacterium]
MVALKEFRLKRSISEPRGKALLHICWIRVLCSSFLLLLIVGCSSYGVIHNEPGVDVNAGQPYSLTTWAQSEEAADFVFIVAFSGGGTRAAAMAYGVLEELRDTNIVIEGRESRLLDEVTHISSVSGGSFTSAYYGLYGDRIFNDFEDEFLRRDVEGHLTKSALNPVHWFTRKGRTERSAEYYNKILFHDATFKDMMQPGRPMIIINASDLAYGIRFSFIQDYFNLLCSDIRDFPVASAVTASSAVPVVFNPVVIENYSGCPKFKPSAQTLEMAKHSDVLYETLEGLESYSDKESRKFIHFVDGGITDNMGLRAMTDVVNVTGGPGQLIHKTQRKIPRHVVVLSVNASTEKRSEMDASAKQPSMLASMNAMTDVQLHRYNAATVDEVRDSLEEWTANISTPEHEVKSYFIEVSFKQVAQPQLKLFLNKIPTSFNLTDEQVEALIKSARDLLREDPEYQQLLAELARP